MPDSVSSVLAAEADGAGPLGAVVPALREHTQALQHRGLPRAGVTLHADHPVGAREHRLDGLLLALVEAAPVQLGLRDPAAHDRLLCPLAPAHQRHRLRLAGDRRVRGPVFPVIEAGSGVEDPLALKLGDGALCGIDRDRAGLAGKRRREQIGMAEYRLAFSEVVRRPGRGIGRVPRGPGEQIGRHRLALPPLRRYGHIVGFETEVHRLLLP